MADRKINRIANARESGRLLALVNRNNLILRSMSRRIHNLRRAFTVSIALLQLTMQSVTLELHIGCDHSHDVSSTQPVEEGRSVAGLQECSCGHDHSTPTNAPDQQNEPHDPHSCPVCQAAFAVPMLGLELPPITSAEVFELLSETSRVAPECEPRFCWLGRGPPAA